MTMREEKIDQEINNFIKALKDKGDLTAAEFFSSAGKACIEKEMPLCVFLGICLNDTDRLDIAIASGADPNLQDPLGNSVLHYAAMHGKRDQIELLLSKTREREINLNVNLLNNSGQTPLDAAIMTSKDSVFDLLTENGARQKVDLDYELSPEHQPKIVELEMLLRKAREQNNQKAIKLLNAIKLSPVPIWPLEFLPPTYDKEAIGLIEWMIENGAKVDVQNSKGKTPLHIAVFFSSAETVQLLCLHDANVNAADSDGFTPLHYATSPSESKYIRGAVEIKIVQDEIKLKVIKTLIDFGADPKIASKDGSTPMDLLNPRLKTEIDGYIAKIASEKVSSVDTSSLDISSEADHSTSEQQDESQDLEKILEEALRELEGEGV